MFNIYDKSLNRIAKIDHFISALWEESFNTHGRFTLELAYNEKIAKLVQLDFTINCANGTQQMTIKTIQATTETIILSGFSSAIAYADRVLVGHLENGSIENSVFDAIEDVQAYPYLSMRKNNLMQTISGLEISNCALDGAIQTACKAADVGYRVVKSGKMLYFELYAPTENPNAKYGGIFGGLTEFELSLSSIAEKNVAVVYGESGQVVYVGEAIGSDRKELFIDMSGEPKAEGEAEAEYLARLAAFGATELVTRGSVLSVEASINDGVLGEKITCIIAPSNIKIKARVHTVSVKMQDNKTEKNVEIGDIAVI